MRRYKQKFEKVDNKYYYISTGNIGMKSNGSFSRDKSVWLIFDQEEKERIEQKNIKPYGATKQGVFININKF